MQLKAAQVTFKVDTSSFRYAIGYVIGWADQLIHIVYLPMFLPNFLSRMRTSLLTWNEIYVLHVHNTRIKLISVSCKHHLRVTGYIFYLI